MRYLPAHDAEPAAEHQTSRGGTVTPLSDWDLREPLPTGQSACCCSASPTVIVVMPPAAPGGDPVDLLLCSHHFRISRPGLEAAGAFAYDAGGRLLLPTV